MGEEEDGKALWNGLWVRSNMLGYLLERLEPRDPKNPIHLNKGEPNSNPCRIPLQKINFIDNEKSDASLISMC
jgi:hypothetical protein